MILSKSTSHKSTEEETSGKVSNQRVVPCFRQYNNHTWPHLPRSLASLSAISTVISISALYSAGFQEHSETRLTDDKQTKADNTLITQQFLTPLTHCSCTHRNILEHAGSYVSTGRIQGTEMTWLANDGSWMCVFVFRASPMQARTHSPRCNPTEVQQVKIE